MNTIKTKHWPISYKPYNEYVVIEGVVYPYNEYVVIEGVVYPHV